MSQDKKKDTMSTIIQLPKWVKECIERSKEICPKATTEAEAVFIKYVQQFAKEKDEPNYHALVQDIPDLPDLLKKTVQPKSHAILRDALLWILSHCCHLDDKADQQKAAIVITHAKCVLQLAALLTHHTDMLLTHAWHESLNKSASGKEEEESDKE